VVLKRRNIMVSAFFLLNEKIVPGTIFSFFEKKVPGTFIFLSQFVGTENIGSFFEENQVFY